MITLYRKNAYGIGIWSIWSEGFEIKISHATTLDGQQVQHSEFVTSGKQSRSQAEQVAFRIASRVSKQKDKGYVEDIEKATGQVLNQLGLDVPMLANSFDETKHKITVAYIQRKLNGLRCLATKQNGEVILYSRRGKAFTALDEIKALMHEILSEGQTFDGELYCHGASLQTIQSWAKRRQKDTLKLQYVVYDCIDDLDFESRYEIIALAIGLATAKVQGFKYVSVLAMKCVNTLDEINESFIKARAAKFEGLMIRLPDFGYECGKRSKSLLKMKDVYSDEGICTNVFSSEKGNPVITISWNGKSFNASPPGSHSQRDKVLFNSEKYIGARVTFEYRELTDDGLPFHAVAVAWRMD